MSDKILEFKGTPVRKIWGSDDFKIYAFNCDLKEYPFLKVNSYNNVSVSGAIHELEMDREYIVNAVETQGKYGPGYTVKNIKLNIDRSEEGTRSFLTAILTEPQANTLMEFYPNIIDLVKDNKVSEVDVTKLKGIKEKTLSKIVKKIQENFCIADLVSSLGGYFNINIVKKLYDNYASVEKVRYELEKNPYKCLCGLSGIGFKKADTLLLSIADKAKEDVTNGKNPPIQFEEELRTSEQRCRACIQFLLEQNEQNGNTWMNLVELRKQVIDIAKESIDTFADAIGHDDTFYDKEGLQIARKIAYDTEKYVAETISAAVKEEAVVWDIDIEKYRNVESSVLTDEQMGALDKLCKENVSILTACAGQGKSFTTKGIISMLDDNKKSVLLIGPTGKSSKVLAEYTGHPASTIHRALGYDGQWHDEVVLDYDVVIVDEFSMVDVYLFKHLLKAIDFNKTRMLIIGDPKQLQSPGAGSLLRDFTESNLIPTTLLTVTFRYKAGGLAKIATDVRNGLKYLDNSMKGKATKFGDDYLYVDVNQERLKANVKMLYKKLLSNGNKVEDIQVLAAMNKGELGCDALNLEIQKIANKNYGTNQCLKYGDTTYYKGDIVIQVQNDYKAELDETYCRENGIAYCYEEPPTAFVANGESGVIVDVTFNSLIIKYDGATVEYKKNKLSEIKLGYAISVHKAQGSSAPIIILCTPKAHTFMLNRNLLYTGLTRMKKSLYHLGSIYTINEAIKRDGITERSTFMQQFLAESFSE